MKYLVMALAVAALVNGTQALAEDAPIVLASQSTYADQHAGGNAVAAFPGEAREDPIVLTSQWTYAERAAGQAVAVNAFPGSARDDIVTVESKSTYADSFTNQGTMQARAASDPALAE